MLERLRELDWTVKLIVLITGARAVLAAIPVPLTWDEGVYYGLASDFYYFGVHYYSALQQLLDFSRPALLTFTLYLVFLITTPNIIVAQYVVFLISLPALYAVYLLGKELYSENVGKFSALALTSGVLGFSLYLGLLTEVPFILFSTLFLLCLVRAEKNTKYYVPAGVSLGLSFLSRYPGILLVFVGLAYIILAKGIRRAIKSPWLYLGLLCTFLTVLPWLLYSQIITGSYLGLYDTYSFINLYWSRVLIQVFPLSFTQSILWDLTTIAYAAAPLFISLFLFPYFFLASKQVWRTKQGLTLILWVAMYLVAYPLINSDARLTDYLRYNQTSAPAVSILVGVGLAMMLANEFQLKGKFRLKGRKKIAVLFILLNVSVAFVGVYFVRAAAELSAPIQAYEYLQYTTYPWQIILTNSYPMASQYTNRLCIWIPDLPSEIDAWANTSYVGAICISLNDYISPIILMHLQTSPLYERGPVLFYQGVPSVIIYYVK
jgi:4-amino-4-deoxy-L-arabinose transferase-like glycosyltransferase